MQAGTNVVIGRDARILAQGAAWRCHYPTPGAINIMLLFNEDMPEPNRAVPIVLDTAGNVWGLRPPVVRVICLFDFD